MSSAVYQEPYKFPAGILALLVHGAFFALLYFGFSWQTQPVASMSVELWQSMPDDAPVRVAVSPPVEVKIEKVSPPPPPPEVIKPDIVIPDKKPIKKVEVKPEVKPVEKPLEKTKVKPVEKPAVKPEAKTPTAKPVQSAHPGVSAAEQQAARDKLAQDAAIGRVVDEYTGKIQGKIRRNIVMPPDVANDARAEYLVTLLPGGRVLSARLLKSSGNAAYDNAVERGILKSDPLPLPADVSLFNQFRELKLGFKPVE